ncbi:unnamed protein product [Callosobruchus maculatus]|uniref:Uncharacterized protein n=1 Tax=Callosobruchus maculatus TaxID=64391 RepID=A0A653CZ39_CALMS|nr:unnamed protein product [Callosobruchus maculatus]
MLLFKTVQIATLILEGWKDELEMPDTKVKLEEDMDCEELKVEVQEVIIKDENVDSKDADRIEKELIVEDWKDELEMPDTKVKLEEDMGCEELKVEVEDVIIKDENVDSKNANRIEKELIVEDWKDELKKADSTVKLEEGADCEELKVEVEEVIIEDENDYLKDTIGGKAVNRIEKELIVEDWKDELEMPDTKVKLEEDMGCEELKVEVEDVIINDENVDSKNANRIEKELIVEDWKDELKKADSTVKLEQGADCEELKVEVEEVIIEDENDYLKDTIGGKAVNRIEKELIVEDWKNELEMAATIVKLEEDADCEELKVEVEEVIIKDENDDLKDANGEIAVNRIEEELNVEDWKDELKKADSTVKLEEGADCENSKLKLRR